MSRSFVMRIALVAACGVLFGGGAALLRPSVPTPQESVHERTLYNTWTERIEKEGALPAYNAFRTSIADASATAQFYDARVFGRALYDATGSAGIEVCGEEFRYACQHGFVARAILADGAEAARELNAWCLTKGRFTKQCQHGLGHGLVAHFGYSESSLARALDVCESLPESIYADKISGCMWGAYMEYYTRYWEHLARAPLDADMHAPLALCEGTDGSKAATCGFATPQWLLDQDTSRDQNERFTTLGAHCRTSTHTLVRTGCFLGAGSQAVQATAFDAAETHALCERVAEGNATDRTVCERGALEQYRSAAIDEPSSCWIATLRGSASSPCDAAPAISGYVGQ